MVEKVLANAKVGAQRFWGSFNTVTRSYSHTDMGGGYKKFPLFKKGGERKGLLS